SEEYDQWNANQPGQVPARHRASPQPRQRVKENVSDYTQVSVTPRREARRAERSARRASRRGVTESTIMPAHSDARCRQPSQYGLTTYLRYLNVELSTHRLARGHVHVQRHCDNADELGDHDARVRLVPR